MVALPLSVLFGGLQIDHLELTADGVTLTARSAAGSAICPQCGNVSARVHSSYQRFPHDRSLLDLSARLQLHVRRFRCATLACPVVTFAERFGDFLKPSAQRTERVQQTLLQLGLALGGAAGARISRSVQMAVSRDSLLRLVRRLPSARVTAPRVLGVDDFALRRGTRYGTILLDLERRCVVDLLPERSAASLEVWLREHPGVEIIARDRGREYVRGATAGAPEALQVADRFHLLLNMREALERVLERAHAALRTRLLKTLPPTSSDSLPSLPAVRARRRSPTEAVMRDTRRERRLDRYETIRELHRQGKSKSQIAQELGVSAWLVRRFVAAEQFPERAPKALRPSILTPFEGVLHERWLAGERTTPALWRAIVAAGYSGSIQTLRHWVQRRRKEPAAHTHPAYRARYTVEPEQVVTRAAAQQRLPGARQLVWLLVKHPDKLSEEEKYLLAVLLQEPSVASAYKLGQRFLHLVRERELPKLDAWIADCHTSQVPDLSNFAAGLQQDDAAVRAALTLPWSSGQVEGQITRLKLLKRQMYGRASFELLRQRVLHAA